METKWQWLGAAGLAIVLGATLAIYWPGLAGPLVLDDMPNLHRLKDIGPVDNLDAFLRFIFAISGNYPSRPLSFASFLINDIAWPLYVPAHKYTGLLVHLINGALVFWLSLLLCRFTNRDSRETAWIALTATALWLLAPLQVSTTLYVIQRMTTLSALFVLCGLIAWCHGRRYLLDRPVAGYVWMTSGLVAFGILGFLSKENAVLITVYILVIEHALLKHHLPIRDSRTRRRFAGWQWLFLTAPTVLLFAVLIYRSSLSGYVHRPYTAFERIASQPRILFDYLQNLLLPTRNGMGVFHDDFPLSTGLLSPPATLLAIVALAAAVVAALWLIRKSPSLFGFAVLWFLAGHLMESSFIGLEPYFEHRNYLPAFGPLFAISYWVWTTRITFSQYIKIGLAVYLVAFVIITRQNVDIWSNKILMVETWARDHPASVRAQALRADVAYLTGHDKEAHAILEQIAARRPHVMASQLQLLWSACLSVPDQVDEYFERVMARIPDTHFDYASIPTLVRLKDSHKQKCPDLSLDELLALTDRVLDNPSTRIRNGAVADILYVKASIAAANGAPQTAASYLYAAFDRNPTYDIGLNAVKYLYSDGAYQAAQEALNDVKSVELPLFDSDNFRSREIKWWQNRIQNKLDAENKAANPNQ